MRGEANPAGGQRKPPSTDAEKQAAAQQFTQGARSGRMGLFGRGMSGVARPQQVGPSTGNEMDSMSGNRAMGVLTRTFREGVRKNAPAAAADRESQTMKKGGSVSASKGADGCAKTGKPKGRMV